MIYFTVRKIRAPGVKVRAGLKIPITYLFLLHFFYQSFSYMYTIKFNRSCFNYHKIYHQDSSLF